MLEENNNQDGQVTFTDIPQASQPEQGYYAGKNSRIIIDRTIGALGTVFFLFVVVPFVFEILGRPLYYYLTAGLLILLSILFFKIGRKNIAIGMMGVYLIPVLLFGACW